MTIKYTKSTVSDRPHYSTQKFGNLLSDTISGDVCQSTDESWNGWIINWSRKGEWEFKFGFSTKKGATRWVNQKLRERGIE